MNPVLFLFENPDDVAARVAVQMGCSLEEALEKMEYFNLVAIETFRVGNDYPREELH
jgi:hypothetical protein